MKILAFVVLCSESYKKIPILKYSLLCKGKNTFLLDCLSEKQRITELKVTSKGYAVCCRSNMEDPKICLSAVLSTV